MKPSSLIIDPEFRDLCPPLSDVEIQNLEESLRSGGMLSPIIYWQTEKGPVVVDGHNRLRLWLENDGLGLDEEEDFKAAELRYGNREDAKEWIIKNQLGRRNLSPDNFQLLLGQLYKSRKKSKDNNLKQNTPKDQNDPSEKSPSTADVIAKEHGVSPATVKRAEKLVDAVEEVKQAEPDLPQVDAVKKAKEKLKEKKTKPPEPAKKTVEEILSARWDKFIQGIAVCDHEKVREWIKNKIKEPAL